MAKRDLNEERFERHIVDTLKSLHGYRVRDDEQHYNRETALDEDLVWEFLEKTQGDVLERAKDSHGEYVRDEVIKRLTRDLNKRGLIDVMRHGVEIDGSDGVEKLRFVYYRPESGLNPETQALYEQNIFSVIRQVHFDTRTEQSLDVVLFLNGIPLCTAELKNELTGQNVSHARRQYENSRDAKLPIFSFKRCAAHFALDTSEVSVTTELKGGKTYFLPFNLGHNNGAGNPPTGEDGKHKTHYLWEEVWSPDSWLELLQHFVHVFKEYSEDADGKTHAVWRQAFPRFHQRKAVNDLLEVSKEQGPSHNYLIHHSAGSGKSMTIAWSAFRLAELFDEDDKPVFDTVIVLTDRRVLNQQLGETVKAFEKQRGVLAQIGEGKTSEDLWRALESGAKIITTTIHKFQVVAEKHGGLPSKNYALIVDEAHSSQSGEMRRSVHQVVGDFDAATKEQSKLEDWVIKQAAARQQPSNVSYYAYTATPRTETLEKFGIKQPDGTYAPFNLYSMRQAIEEGFILDVLKNYTTYKSYFKLVKSADEDPEVKKKEAMQRLVRYARTHELVLEQKVDIMVTHFEETVKDVLYGDEKAMIVTDSRESAVRYQLAMEKYLREKGYPYKSLVAFTDTVKLDGQEYTESGLNGIPESKTAKTFKGREYKFLIVAEKYQTGFDEPKLCAMYVNKTLSGVQAVQTLSRLNRRASGKDRVFILDFVNSFDDIQAAFEPYYTSTILSEGVDVGLLGDTRRLLMNLFRINDEELDAFALILSEDSYEGDRHERVNAFLDKMADEIIDKLTEEEYADFKTKLHFYLWLYPYVAQVVSYTDVSHEKLFMLLHPLAKKLPGKKREKPFPVENYVDLKTLRVVRKHSGSIVLDAAVEELEQEIDIPEPSDDTDEKMSLSQIISGMNKKWGADFGKQQEETLEGMTGTFSADEELQEVINNPANPKDNAKIVFEHMFDDVIHSTYDKDEKLYTTLMNNEELRKDVRNQMFRYVFGRVLAGDEQKEVANV